MAYSQVSYGSTGSDVTELQKLLNKTNNSYNLSEDGKFGAKTQAAVKDYQKKNGLAVDGIVGKNTWGALTKSTAPTTPTQQATVPTTASGDSQPNWQAKLNETLDKILNREKFSYDVNGDALYQQYKDLYTNQGKQAMMDTMGQASAMTGGYGSSYAQTVGQQTYQGYLQQLNDKVPELYQLALDQYNQEGQKLYDQYGLYLNERDYEHQLEREAVEDELNKKMYDYQLERDRIEDANRTQDNARSDVYAFLQSGVMPSDDLISAAGLDKATVEGVHKAYSDQIAASGGDDDFVDASSEIPDKYIQKAATFEDNESLANWAYDLVDTGVITEDQADQLIAENMDHNEKYTTDDKGNSKISYKDMVTSTKGWTVVDDGAGNLIGIDANAKVKSPNNETLTLKQLKQKLIDEGMKDGDATSAIKKLQQNLGISSNWLFGL